MKRARDEAASKKAPTVSPKRARIRGRYKCKRASMGEPVQTWEDFPSLWRTLPPGVQRLALSCLEQEYLETLYSLNGVYTDAYSDMYDASFVGKEAMERFETRLRQCAENGRHFRNLSTLTLDDMSPLVNEQNFPVLRDLTVVRLTTPLTTFGHGTIYAIRILSAPNRAGQLDKAIHGLREKFPKIQLLEVQKGVFGRNTAAVTTNAGIPDLFRTCVLTGRMSSNSLPGFRSARGPSPVRTALVFHLDTLLDEGNEHKDGAQPQSPLEPFDLAGFADVNAPELRRLSIFAHKIIGRKELPRFFPKLSSYILTDGSGVGAPVIVPNVQAQVQETATEETSEAQTRTLR